MPPESGSGVTASRQHARPAARSRGSASVMSDIFREWPRDVILEDALGLERGIMNEAPSSERSIGAMFGASANGTFLGLPKASIYEASRASVAILGAPAATPYPSVGPYCAGGPTAI